jgi:hypothetical protein
MEIEQLPNILLTILTIGMILGVCLLVFDNFNSSTRTVTRITNESCAQAAGKVTLANIPLKELVSYGNSSKGFTTVFNCAGCKVNYTLDTGELTVSTGTYKNTGSNYKATYDYYANNTVTATVTDVRNATIPIGSTWLGLLVTIIVLAIILGMVMKAFNSKR